MSQKQTDLERNHKKLLEIVTKIYDKFEVSQFIKIVSRNKPQNGMMLICESSIKECAYSSQTYSEISLNNNHFKNQG